MLNTFLSHCMMGAPLDCLEKILWIIAELIIFLNSSASSSATIFTSLSQIRWQPNTLFRPISFNNF